MAWPREQHQRKSPLFTRAKETLSKAFGGEPAQKHSFGSEAFYFAAECLFDWPPLLMCRTTGPGQARDPESGRLLKTLTFLMKYNLVCEGTPLDSGVGVGGVWWGGVCSRRFGSLVLDLTPPATATAAAAAWQVNGFTAQSGSTVHFSYSGNYTFPPVLKHNP